MILGIGTVVEDHVVVLDQHPELDSKNMAQDHWRQIGGPVPVALSVAAFYGAGTQFVGRWGADRIGDNIAATLATRNIDTSHCICRDEWSSGFAHVWCCQDDGTRTLVTSRGHFPGNAQLTLRADLLKNCSLLHTDGTDAHAVAEAARVVRANGGMVVLDAGSAKPGLSELLPFVDLLIASQLFRNCYFRSTDPLKHDITSLGVREIITTDGSSGCRWYFDETSNHQPALEVDVVDSNGAGDVFCGALLYAISQKRNRGAALAFANAVAGLTCQQRGNYPPPKLDEVRQHVDW